MPHSAQTESLFYLDSCWEHENSGHWWRGWPNLLWGVWQKWPWGSPAALWWLWCRVRGWNEWSTCMIAHGQSLVHRHCLVCRLPLASLFMWPAMYPCVLVQTSIPVMWWILFWSFSNVCVESPAPIKAAGHQNRWPHLQVIKVFVLIRATTGCVKGRTLNPFCLLEERMHDSSQVTGH